MAFSYLAVSLYCLFADVEFNEANSCYFRPFLSSFAVDSQFWPAAGAEFSAVPQR